MASLSAVFNRSMRVFPRPPATRPASASASASASVRPTPPTRRASLRIRRRLARVAVRLAHYQEPASPADQSTTPRPHHALSTPSHLPPHLPSASSPPPPPPSFGLHPPPAQAPPPYPRPRPRPRVPRPRRRRRCLLPRARRAPPQRPRARRPCAAPWSRGSHGWHGRVVTDSEGGRRRCHLGTSQTASIRYVKATGHTRLQQAIRDCNRPCATATGHT